jgi:hypothetical protein
VCRCWPHREVADDVVVALAAAASGLVAQAPQVPRCRNPRRITADEVGQNPCPVSSDLSHRQVADLRWLGFSGKGFARCGRSFTK